ncbi:Hsp70 family protein [Corynebacterium freiburgense]|uniref:Hsp70 family protein n=1 Tax=Corynebacterium freiburgense TaxID=556548 RepID=UPI00040AE21A|nr:Hsp70 family protein [Corynebacterium freiburgense]WJZ01433.1 Chaperone protein DnaK [Corynebacterium freiburgense]
MSRNHWTIGIDFGTSNTAAAHTNPIKGTVEAVNLSHDRTTMSSAVYVESPEQIDVGDVAVNKAESNPAGFVPAPKRVIPQQMFQINGYDVPSSMPVAAVLSSVVQRVSREHGNEQPSELVLTHPEAWSSNEIKVLLDAAAQLGLEAAKITTISEPQAAAHYYSRAKSLEPGQRIAVFDFGGGTLDIAVLQANENNTFDVIAARGDNTLGGKSFDALMRKWVDQQLEDRNPDLLDYFRTQAPLQERHALEDSIRRAKELLSEASYATVAVSGRGETERFQITRAEFEQLISPLLEKAAELTQTTLADAGITDASELVALYLTGGSSRIPIVQERLKEFGPLATLDDPKTVVAQGAISALGPIVRGMTPQNMGAPQPEFGASTGAGWASTPQTNNNPYQPQPSQVPAAFTGSAKGGDMTPTAKSKLSTRTIGILAAAAVAVLVIGGISTYKFVSGQNGNATNTSETIASSEPSSEQGNSGLQTSVPEEDKLDSLDKVVAAVPATITASTDKCKIRETGETGALHVRCEIKKDSPDFQYFTMKSDYDIPQIEFAIDPHESTFERRRIVQGIYEDRDQDNLIVEDESGTKAAHFVNVDSQSSYRMKYANTETGLLLSSSDFKDKATGEEYLRSKGLL